MRGEGFGLSIGSHEGCAGLGALRSPASTTQSREAGQGWYLSFTVGIAPGSFRPRSVIQPPIVAALKRTDRAETKSN